MGNKIILPSGAVLTVEGDAKEVSDTKHSFGELYNHRIMLFMAFMVMNPKISFRASYHNDGTFFEGNFIAGMQLPQGQITYHIPLEYWNMLSDKGIKTQDFAPEWDGHSSDDVIERLYAFIVER